MSVSSVAAIKDVQGKRDERAVAITQVGIRALRLPMMFTEGSIPIPAVGEWSCFTDLPAEARGTHMSRLVKILHDAGMNLKFSSFCDIPAAALEQLPMAKQAHVAVKFRAFSNKQAPISREQGYVDFDAAFYGWRQNNQLRSLLSATVPVTSLCPCSKTISKYGAHNQRSHVTCALEIADDMRLLDLMSIIEQSASCELYSMLKRPDERHVTERAYDNPKFVEDIVRDLAVVVSRLPNVRNYRVSAENFESIHNHSAYAMIESTEFPSALLT